MAVRMHGLRTGVAHPRHDLPLPRRAAPAPEAPRARPLPLGRLLYGAVLLFGALLAASWLLSALLFVQGAGVVERDVDRLSAQERGRITRLAVRAGDAVKKGQPLVHLEYGRSGVISDAAARAQQQQQQQLGLRGRRQELLEREALLRGTLAALQARSEGLQRQERAAQEGEQVARRLLQGGAATVAEVGRLAQQRAQLGQARLEAEQQLTAQRGGLPALREEVRQIEAALRQAPPPPAEPAEAGVLTATRDGQVLWLAHREGEVVGPGDPILLIADGSVQIRAEITPRDALSLAPEQAALVQLPTGDTLTGRVRRVHPMGNALEALLAQSPSATLHTPSGMMQVDVEVPAAALSAFPAGTPCEVRLRRRAFSSLASRLLGPLRDALRLWSVA